jgi:RND family efflux transporter MFP subunit
LDVSIQMPAEIEPYESVAIFPRVSGFVKTVKVDRGSKVKAGQTLAVLEAPELTAQLSEAQAKLQSAEATLAALRAKADASAATQQKLIAASATPGVVAGNDLFTASRGAEADASQAAAAERLVEAARDAARSVQQMESYLTVVAPFDGVVTERNTHPGALAGPNTASATPLFRVVQVSRLRVVVALPEAYTAGLHEGLALPFSVRAFPDDTFSGTVARIARAIDPKTRTMAVELEVANADGRLAPGTFAQVRWPVERTGPSLLIPATSVASTTDRVFVVRIRDDVTEWVTVQTGLTSGSLVEVFGDLRAGDQIAVRGTDELRPGTKVHTKLVSTAS